MEKKSTKKNRLTLYIGIALVIGIVSGFILNKTYVGDENTKIANAEIQSEHLQQQMHLFEKIKDSTVFTTLQKQQQIINDQKKAAEQALLNTEDETAGLATIKVLSDSLKFISSQLSLQTDTASSGYKVLVKQKELISLQKNENLKARDKKLEWFTILADVFLRLIKMIVAPLVFTTLVVGVAKLGDIKSVGRIGGKTLLWFLSASLMSL